MLLPLLRRIDTWLSAGVNTTEYNFEDCKDTGFEITSDLTKLDQSSSCTFHVSSEYVPDSEFEWIMDIPSLGKFKAVLEECTIPESIKRNWTLDPFTRDRFQNIETIIFIICDASQVTALVNSTVTFTKDAI